MLLASLIIALSSIQLQAEAAPTRRNAGMVTLPLKRHHRARDGIHPQVLHQLHMNRGSQRLARMTGRRLPSPEELAERLRKRVEAVGGSVEELAKRFNRSGVPHNGKRFNRHGVPKPGKRNPAEIDVIQPIQGSAADMAASPSPGTGIGGPAAEGAASVGDLAVAITPTANNSLGLDIELNDVGYSATLQLGTPPRDFLLLMDSGSADFWVGSETCQADPGPGDCGNHQFLGPLNSSTFQDSGTPWNIQYGLGSASGTIVKDNLVLAGLSLPGHVFGVASQESVQFSDPSTPFDGILGLAKSTISEQQTLTPIEAMKANGLVQSAITSYKISRLADGLNDGEITFGALDESKFDPNTLQVINNVNKRGFWEAPMPSITVNGKDIGLKGRTAILDTGTTLIIAPTADAVAVHRAIPGAASDGQGGFTVPCNIKTSLALKFGNRVFTIDPRDLAVAQISRGSNTCVSGISSGKIGTATEWLVGDVFLKNAYFSHDVDTDTISLAKLV